jgi:eukaryotic-like serine/threonine-protein kinase
MRPQSKMQTDYFKQLQVIFDAALEQSAETRAEFVSQVCGEDHAMAEEVMSLIEYEALGAASSTAKPFALAAAAFDAAEAKSLIGQVVGRFRLEAEIASGGMGRVFRAKRIDEGLDQTVALKLIRQELFNPELLRRFSSERQILASLNHPGIAHFIDAGKDEQGSPFVAMEYVDGFPLLDYCARNALSIRDRISLFRQILAAVSYAHRNLVVHRDLKPANVLVTSEGQVKLLDFGIAKALRSDQLHTATVDHFFTPAYAAPEQLLKESIAVTCDVYALGAILYTLLTGVPPFDLSRLSAGDIERHILKIPPAPMQSTALKRGESALRAQGIENSARWAKLLDGDLESIAQKALRKEPDARYISVEQFDDDLARYLDHLPVKASRAGLLYRAKKFFDRNTLAVSLSVIACMAIFGGAGYVAKQNRDIRAERDRAQAALQVLKNSFKAANPASPDGRNYSQARVMLAAAAREVAALEKRQPALFRDLASEIGEIQVNLGMSRDGLALIRRANRAAVEPSDEGLVLEIYALIRNNELKKARWMLDSQQSRLQKYSDFSAKKAYLLKEEKRYEEAIKICESLLADRSAEKRSIGNWPILRDAVRFSLMESYVGIGSLKRAVVELDKIVIDRRQRYGADHPLTTVARLRRTQILIQTGDVAAVERELVAMKPLFERNQDQASDATMGYHNTYGRILGDQGHEEEALVHFLKALDSTELVYGPDSVNAAVSRFNIAQAMTGSRTDRREAYPHFLKAIAVMEKIDRSDWRVGVMRLKTAQAYAMDGDNLSAQQVLTPEYAMSYFKAMPEPVSAEYMQALHAKFGRQSCDKNDSLKIKGQAQSEVVAHALVCRYDPEGTHRRSNWPFLEQQ